MNSFFSDLRHYFKNDKNATGNAPKRGVGSGPQQRRLHVESLEERDLLAICYVDADASAGGNGSSWNSAYKSLQDALDAAAVSSNQITEVWVAEGTYTPKDVSGFSLVNGVSLYGGFAGTESNLSQRSRNSQGEFVYQTVLSGDLAQNDDPTNASTFNDNAYTVLFANALTSATTVDGVTVSGGYAHGLTFAVDTIETKSVGYGGGIVLYNSTNVTLSNIVVSNNYASNAGGGIYVEGGNTTIQNGSFANNSTNANGGGLYLTSGTLTVSGSTFTDNYADSSGGGLYQYGGTLTMTTSHFSGNVGSYGGGLTQASGGTGTITNSSFISNIAQDVYTVGGEGGGIHQSGRLNLTDVTIAGNVARTGAGVFFYNEVTPDGEPTLEASTYQNLTISRNVAREIGGGLYIRNGLLNLEASIIAVNTASQSPDVYGELNTYDGSPKVGLVFTGSNNLIGNGTGIPPVSSSATSPGVTIANGVNGNQVGGSGSSAIDPMLGAPTDSGNGVFVLPVRSGSPALGKGMKIGAVETASTDRAARTYTVTSLSDTIAEDGVVTFREAFEAANRNIKVGDAEAGSFTETDVIVFAAGLTGTINLNGKSLTIYDGLTITGGDLTAGTGSQNSLIIDANNLTTAVKAVGAISVNISGLTLANGYSRADGGALLAYGSTVTLNQVTVKNSQSDGRQGGGGIYALKATLNATDIIVSGCSAQSGGGIYANETTATIVGASVYSNSAVVSGGGIYIYNHSTQSVVSNATIARNEAKFGAGFAISNASTRLTHLTVTRNVGDESGGMLLNRSSTVEMNNSIVADNFSYRDTDISVYTNSNGSSTNAVLTGSNNLVGNNTGLTGLTGSTNKIGTASSPLDPQFYSASLYNGQLIYTLKSTSQAVNAGSNALSVGKTGETLQNDVRGSGYSRASGSSVDMGACEYQSSLVAGINSPAVAMRKGQTMDLQGFVVTGSSSGVTYLWDLNNNGIYGEIGDAATEGLEIDERTTFDSTNAVRESGGSYPVRLIIVDANGNRSDPTELQLEIISNAATYVIYGETTFYALDPQQWRIEAMNAVSDPIMSWTIIWGDSDPEGKPYETVIAGGPRNDVDVRHVYSSYGTYTLTIRAVTYFGDIQTYALAKFQVLAAASSASQGFAAETATQETFAASFFVETPMEILDEPSIDVESHFEAEPISAVSASALLASDPVFNDYDDSETDVLANTFEQRFSPSQRRNVWGDWNAEVPEMDLAQIATLEKASQQRAADDVLAAWSEFDEFLPRRTKHELFE